MRIILALTIAIASCSVRTSAPETPCPARADSLHCSREQTCYDTDLAHLAEWADRAERVWRRIEAPNLARAQVCLRDMELRRAPRAEGGSDHSSRDLWQKYGADAYMSRLLREPPTRCY